MILLDTHVLLWLMAGDNKLGRLSRKQIDEAYHQGKLSVSAISFWEISMLQNKGRIELSDNIQSWRKQLLRQGIIEMPIDGKIGIDSTNIENFHADPADRLIVSTAILNDAVLVTADGKILAWESKLKRIDASE